MSPAAAVIGDAMGAPCAVRFTIDYEGCARTLSLPLGESIYIGRALTGAVVLDDAGVSGKHVELIAVPDGTGHGRLHARDLSRNGTGIVDPDGVPIAAGQAVDTERRKLSSDAAEELPDGVELVVPHKRKLGVRDAKLHRLVVRLLQPVSNGILPVAGGKSASACAPPPRPLPAAVCASAVPVASLIDTSFLPEVFDPVTGQGRWRYEVKLGEGGLGMVYRATDMKGSLGDVAVKVLKRRHKFVYRDARHAFAMHREALWSLRFLHNREDPRFDEDGASLFARYLEDHTGFAELPPADEDAKRVFFESPGLNWDTDAPLLPERPYCVMELVCGEHLQMPIDRERRGAPLSPQEPPPLSPSEKRVVLLETARSLEYLARFELLHRDFRGCNMHMVARESSDGTTPCRLMVLDLGVMIRADPGQETNTNLAVQAFRRRGDTEEKRKRYDWLPWEVRGEGDAAPPVNFSGASHTFDVFSYGVLILHLLVGKSAARSMLDDLQNGASMPDTSALGFDAAFVGRMLGDANQRPTPLEIRSSLVCNLAHLRPARAVQAALQPRLSVASSKAAVEAPRGDEAEGEMPVAVSVVSPLGFKDGAVAKTGDVPQPLDDVRHRERRIRGQAAEAGRQSIDTVAPAADLAQKGKPVPASPVRNGVKRLRSSSSSPTHVPPSRSPKKQKTSSSEAGPHAKGHHRKGQQPKQQNRRSRHRSSSQSKRKCSSPDARGDKRPSRIRTTPPAGRRSRDGRKCLRSRSRDRDAGKGRSDETPKIAARRNSPEQSKSKRERERSRDAGHDKDERRVDRDTRHELGGGRRSREQPVDRDRRDHDGRLERKHNDKRNNTTARHRSGRKVTSVSVSSGDRFSSSAKVRQAPSAIAQPQVVNVEDAEGVEETAAKAAPVVLCDSPSVHAEEESPTVQGDELACEPSAAVQYGTLDSRPAAAPALVPVPPSGPAPARKSIREALLHMWDDVPISCDAPAASDPKASTAPGSNGSVRVAAAPPASTVKGLPVNGSKAARSAR